MKRTIFGILKCPCALNLLFVSAKYFLLLLVHVLIKWTENISFIVAGIATAGLPHVNQTHTHTHTRTQCLKHTAFPSQVLKTVITLIHTNKCCTLAFTQEWTKAHMHARACDKLTSPRVIRSRCLSFLPACRANRTEDGGSNHSNL